MKFTWFNLMPWPHLPDDFRKQHRSVWVDIDPKLYDPVKGEMVSEAEPQHAFANQLLHESRYLQLRADLVGAGQTAQQDYDAVMATAQAARAAGASRCGVVTAMGANAHSRIFYNRVKGEVERDLQALGFATLVIARPSLMIGERQALQQAARPAESLSIQLFKWLDPLIPDNYRARPGADVGRALVRAVQSGPPGLQVLSGRALRPT